MLTTDDPRRPALVRHGFILEYLTLAWKGGKAKTGRALDNPVLRTEGRVTTIDGILAVAVLLGLILNARRSAGGGQNPAAGYVLVYYALREVREILTDSA